jgi:hypothetical protein
VNFSKTEKGIVGEKCLLYAIDAARNVDLIKNIYKLGQPQKLSTAHQYPDLYCEGVNFEYLFEMRNVFWYLGYQIGEDAFVNNLLGKVWTADEYPLEHSGRAYRDHVSGKTVWRTDPNKVVHVHRKENLIPVYVSTVPFLSNPNEEKLWRFFSGRMVYSRHPFYDPNTHVKDQHDLDHLLQAQSNMTAAIVNLVKNIEDGKEH